jgi:Type II secretion system (T2SS), protein E, N-terminal domain
VREPLRPIPGRSVSALPLPSIGPSDKGITPPTRPGGREGFLSDVIVELGFADRATVDKAERAARSPGTTVAGVLLDSGAITEDQLAHARAERHGLPYLDLEVYDVDPAAANLITPAAARQHRCVPVGRFGPRLVLAVADPADATGAGMLAGLEGVKTLAAVACGPALDDLIARLPLPGPAGELEAVEDPAAPDPPPGPPRDAPVAQPEARQEDPGLREDLLEAEARLEEAKTRSREHQRELATARMEVEARTMELEVLRTKLTEAESDVVRARAEAEHAGHEARTLRTQLETETRRRAAVEGRLSRVESELFVAEQAAQEVRDAQRRIRASLGDEPRPG